LSWVTESHLTLSCKTSSSQYLTRYYLDFFQIFDERDHYQVPVKIVGKSKGVMAGGDLDNRKLVKTKIFCCWDNKLYMLHKFLLQTFFKIMHPDNTVICHVIFVAMLAQGCKSAKAKTPARKEK
jgi:large subunit ribosomal protein L25